MICADASFANTVLKLLQSCIFLSAILSHINDSAGMAPNEIHHIQKIEMFHKLPFGGQ